MSDVDWLNDPESRATLIDLAYSLHQCLGDFVVDCERLKYDPGPNDPDVMDRITMSAMNCVADIHLLLAPLQMLASSRAR